MFVNESLETLADIGSSPCRYAHFRRAVSSGNYPAEEAWRESLAEVYFNEVFVNVCGVVNVELG
jgi:hypothetical protein